MVQRGAGQRDARQLLHDLENLGVDYSGGASNSHVSFGGATLSERILDALAIFADIVQRPQLPESQLEDSRQVCLQEILALEDDLARRAMIDLRRRHYPMPLGRDHRGTRESVSAIGAADVRRQVAEQFVPQGTILAVAGNFQWEQLRARIGDCFGSWQGGEQPAVETRPAERGYRHLPYDSSQTHIAAAYATATPGDDDFYRALAVQYVLGDGFSSRLFTEIREERGLCYSVGASYHAIRDDACVQCYAGTTNERAQETLDVMLAEIEKLADGVREEELRRLKARFKSSRIMQQESSPARSGSMASQWYHLGRVRTLQETAERIEALTCEDINRYLADHPPRAVTICTLGASKLETPVEVS
jgi:predicted Zn-dependent peptidase